MSKPNSDYGWYCVRTHPKHEHIAAAYLRQLEQVEVYNPRIRSRRMTRRGQVWVTEPLFPNYLFVQFDLATQLDQVKFANGVSTIVHFGLRFPMIPEETIQELRESMDGQEMKIFEDMLHEGDEVTIMEGAFRGLNAKVLRVLPESQRVRVLLDILGRATPMEVSLRSIAVEKTTPAYTPGR